MQKEDRVLQQKQSGDTSSLLDVALQGGLTSSDGGNGAAGVSVDQFYDISTQVSGGSQHSKGGAMKASAEAKTSVARGPKVIVKSGRKSDPRMDRAVEAKLADPSLPLLDALREGGFVFPSLDDSATPQYTVVDSDNVKITQRKNQLLRRVRTAKKGQKNG